MSSLKKTLIVMVLVTLGAAQAFGNEPADRRGRHRPPTPPPEAYSACEGKAAGDTAQFTGPNGETVSGTCEEMGDRLALRPDHFNAREGGRRHGPPPEAYTACEGKNAGDSAQFESPHGETVTGTCKEERGRLVLRPDRQ